MDLKQLRVLLAIADQGSFSAAANMLKTVQSNISAHISKLEHELGTTLIDRSTLRLTKAGQIVADKARLILAELDNMVTELDSSFDQHLGLVRIGVIPLVASWLIPSLCRELIDLEEPIRLNFDIDTSANLADKISTAVLDISILTRSFQMKDIECQYLYSEKIVLALPQKYKSRIKTKINLADILSLNLVLPNNTIGYRRELTALFERLDLPPLRPIIEASTTEHVKLIAQQLGLPTIIPYSMVVPELESGFVTTLVPQLSNRDVCIARKKSSFISPAAAKAMRAAESIIKAKLNQGLRP